MMSWKDMVEYSETNTLHAQQLYIVSSTPTNGLDPILANLDPHVEYQKKLERDGVMFAAGPIASDDLQEWPGEGLFVYRAQSLEQATAYAENDPMHRAGARSFRVRLWLFNEGNPTIG
jgi:uncharacterized protein YciI